MQSQDEWVPCVFELETQPGKIASSTWTIRNVDATDANLSFVLPLPTRKGGMRLHLSGITVGVQDASPGNSVTQFHARGINFDKSTVLDPSQHLTPINSPTKAQHLFAPVDCSLYDAVKVVVYLECTTPHGVDISFVTAKCHYA